MAVWTGKHFRARWLLTAGLLLAACAIPSPWAMARDLEGVQPLYDKAAAEGSVRIIVTVQFSQLPNRGSIAPQEFDSLLSDRASVAQSRVIEALPPATVVKGPTRFRFTPQFVVTVTAEGLAALAGNPDVTAMQEDVPEFPLLDQSVPHIFPGHATSPYTGNGWTVAILDTGVDRYHPFLSGKVVAEACYSTSSSISSSVCPGGVSSSTAPDSGLPCSSLVSGCDHGTHVAGIAAGSGLDFAGVARNADLIAVQVFTRIDSSAFCGSIPVPCAATFPSDQILGMQQVYALRSIYAIASINMSLGGGYYTAYCDGDSRKATIDLLKSAGIATVIASGNNGYTDGVSAPGCISTAITVGATNDTVDTRASFSNSGPQLDLYAPGLSIYSSVPGGGYSAKGGTSMATPHVAGAWAVLKEKYSTETVDETETRFANSGVTVTSNGISRQRLTVDEALGPTGNGFGYVPVSPCRIVDTRKAGGKIPDGSARGFKVYGDNSTIQGQGGTGDCGVSWTSKAIVLNITSTEAAGTGHFRVYPYGSPVPEATILNMPAGLTVANATISNICQPSCLNDIEVYSSTDSHVVIDVMGYME
ncbi:MAG: S8 family peptidase [Desulfobulbaceae bacterium]